ncbi:MAG: hypothetical protein Q4F03_09440 [Eubacteriales bacterium]|nr:hypothetical protein [Eubacteriales bacterium]
MKEVHIFLILYPRGQGKLKKGHYKYFLCCQSQTISEEKEIRDTTGRRIALECLIDALKRMRQPSLLTIHTDNKYLLEGYTRLQEWKANGWARCGKKELKNADLWRQAEELLKPHAVRFKNECMEIYK